MLSADQSRPEASGQLEVSEVIGRELYFKSTGIEGQVRHRHDPGAVHQNVQGNAYRQETLGEGRR